MRRPAFIFLTILIPIISNAQTMRPISDLINTTDPGWPLVQQWISEARNKVEVLPLDTTNAKEALYNT
jgi:hypothetical protein